MAATIQTKARPPPASRAILEERNIKQSKLTAASASAFASASASASAGASAYASASAIESKSGSDSESEGDSDSESETGSDSESTPAPAPAPFFSRAKASTDGSIMPGAEVMNFFRRMGYAQYGAALASAGFCTMTELTLIIAGALKRLNVLGGHALSMLHSVKTIPLRSPSPPVHKDFMNLCKKRLAAPPRPPPRC